MSSHSTGSEIKEAMRIKFIQLLIDDGYLKGSDFIVGVKPTHGNCCTCQTCGYAHEDCVCSHNELLKKIKEL